MSRTSVALGNLRAFVILVVLAFHSVLAYLGSLPPTAHRFDEPPYDWLSNPIIDSRRWFGFDLFCAWNDVYLMSLMFFLSGLFVWASLTRKGTGTYLWGRVLRLGLPLVLGLVLLMPLAHYPSYLATTTDPSLATYWSQFIALPSWPSAHLWFIWQLLVLSAAAAVLYRFPLGPGENLARWTASLREHPSRFFIALVAASAIAYIPLALTFSPWSWFQFGPFGFQLSRPVHYAVYFFAGLSIGAHGIERGVLAIDGALARRWLWWLGIAFVSFCCWIIPMALIMQSQPESIALQVLADFGYVLGCAGSCLFALAIVLRFATSQTRILDNLSANSYGMYLVHYPFVVWLQYGLLGIDLPGVAKAAIVFAGTLALSWSAAAVMRALPLRSRPTGPDRRELMKSQ